MMKQYYVYIMTNHTGTLYTRVNNSLERRVWEHKTKFNSGFTSRYNINRLVHCEVYDDIRDAIAREIQIKGWSRAKKVTLIESDNPGWKDLSEGWFK